MRSISNIIHELEHPNNKANPHNNGQTFLFYYFKQSWRKAKAINTTYIRRNLRIYYLYKYGGCAMPLAL